MLFLSPRRGGGSMALFSEDGQAALAGDLLNGYLIKPLLFSDYIAAYDA